MTVQACVKLDAPPPSGANAERLMLCYLKDPVRNLILPHLATLPPGLVTWGPQRVHGPGGERCYV